MQDIKLIEENEKKKEYLKSYQRAIRREKEIEDEIRQLRLDKMFPSVVNDGMPKGTNQSDLSGYAALLDEQISKLIRERYERAKLRADIENSIRAMSNEDEQSVLRLRYIKGLKWEEIAVEMKYSYMQTHRIHSRALINFQML